MRKITLLDADGETLFKGTENEASQFIQDAIRCAQEANGATVNGVANVTLSNADGSVAFDGAVKDVTSFLQTESRDYVAPADDFDYTDDMYDECTNHTINCVCNDCIKLNGRGMKLHERKAKRAVENNYADEPPVITPISLFKHMFDERSEAYRKGRISVTQFKREVTNLMTNLILDDFHE